MMLARFSDAGAPDASVYVVFPEAPDARRCADAERRPPRLGPVEALRIGADGGSPPSGEASLISMFGGARTSPASMSTRARSRHAVHRFR